MPNNAQNKSSNFMAKKGDSDNSSSPYTSIWPSEFDRHTDNRDQSPVDKSVWYFVTSSMNRYIDEAAKYSHEISHLTVCLTANPKRDRIFFRLCWMILMVQSTVIFPPPACSLEKKNNILGCCFIDTSLKISEKGDLNFRGKQ